MRLSRQARAASVLTIPLISMLALCACGGLDGQWASETNPYESRDKADSPTTSGDDCTAEWPLLLGKPSTPNKIAYTKMIDLFERIDSEQKCYEDPYVESCSWVSVESKTDLVRWKEELERIGALDRPLAQLEAVNQYVNKTPFESDREIYGTEDYWATPSSFMQNSGGDCEDFVTTKYVSLRRLGFCDAQMRYVIVNDLQNGLAHTILAVLLEGTVYVLDNQNRMLLPQEDVIGYLPSFSMNRSGIWHHFKY